MNTRVRKTGTHVRILALIAGLLLAVLALPAMGKQVTNQQGSDPLAAATAEVTRLTGQGWTATGPVSVKRFLPGKEIQFLPERSRITFNLKGKSLIVKNESLSPTSQSALTAGSVVYICSMGNEVTVILLNKLLQGVPVKSSGTKGRL